MAGQIFDGLLVDNTNIFTWFLLKILNIRYFEGNSMCWYLTENQVLWLFAGNHSFSLHLSKLLPTFTAPFTAYAYNLMLPRFCSCALALVKKICSCAFALWDKSIHMACFPAYFNCTRASKCYKNSLPFFPIRLLLTQVSRFWVPPQNTQAQNIQSLKIPNVPKYPRLKEQYQLSN